jgi:hypothetical protein
VCDSRLKGFLYVAVALSFIHPAFLLLALYPLGAAAWSRWTGRPVWPMRSTCAVPNPPRASDGTH